MKFDSVILTFFVVFVFDDFARMRCVMLWTCMHAVMRTERYLPSGTIIKEHAVSRIENKFA